jgi:hypothetical protein
MAALTVSQFQAFAGPRFQGTYLGKVLSLASNGAFNKKKTSFTSAVGPTAAYGIDLIHAEINELAASGTDAYDLTALADVAGVTRSFARIKYLWLFLPGTDDNADISVQNDFITLGGNASNGHLMWLANVSDKYKVKAGNYVEVADFSAAGEVVSGSLKAFDVIATSGNTATYAMVIGGCLT